MTLYSILWYFILYSFIGWCIEVVFCSVDTGKFVNRGFLNGPVCPIYGFGAVAIILLLRPVSQSLLLLYVASVFITSLLELVTGFVLKKLFHTSWWDYSDEPFNIGGYICLKFSLAWGLGGVALVRGIHPAVQGLVSLVPHTLGIVLLCIFLALFVADLIVTVNVITKLNRDLGEITRLAGGLHKGSEAIAKNLGDGAIKVTNKLEPGKAKLESKWAEGKEYVSGMVQQGKDKLEESKQIRELQKHGGFFRRRLLRAFPNMRHSRYAEALRSMRENLKINTDKKSEKKPENISDENTDSK